MFLGLGQGRDRNQNFSTCWGQLQAGFKFFFLLDITLAILSLFLGGFFFGYCTNLVELTIGRFQIWRLVTSFMLPSLGQMMIINVLFDMWILYQYMPDIVHVFKYRKKEIRLPTLSCRSFYKYSYATWLWLSSATRLY